jgi:tetratricopeptide (TPR) repeat protein
LGRHADAVAAAETLIAMNQADAETYNNRSVSLYALGRYGEAIASYDRALAASPRLAAAMNNRGDALRMLGPVWRKRSRATRRRWRPHRASRRRWSTAAVRNVY